MRAWEWALLVVASAVFVVAAMGLVMAPAPPRAEQTIVFVNGVGTPQIVQCPPAPQECRIVVR